MQFKRIAEMKLRDVIQEFISGDWGQEALTDDAQNEVFCIRGADIVPISNNNFDDIPQRYITSKSKRSRLLQKGDIVIEKSGGSPVQSTGRVVYISENLLHNKGEIVCSNFCCAIRIKDSWNPKFIYYYWNHIYNSGVFFNYEGKTSGIKNLMLDAAISSIEIPDFTLKTQNEIVDILERIENKIAINQEINRNLEALARQLYEYWFVQFDFPDENGRPYKTSGGKMVWNEELKREIPEGWEVKNIFEEVEVQYGFPFSTNLFTEEKTLIPIVRIRDILNGTVSAYSKEKADFKYKLSKGDLIVGMDGNFHMNLWSDNISYLNQRSVRFRQKLESPVSTLQLFFEIAPYIKAKEQNSKGSTVGHLSDKDLKRLRIIRPIITRDFNSSKTFNDISSVIICNRNEISKLNRQKDELLPLLMNGQVSVKPTEINCDLSLY